MTTSRCQRESVTAFDDGTLTVDCSMHGEVAMLAVGSTAYRVAAETLDVIEGAIEAAWAAHVAATPVQPEQTADELPGIPPW